MKSLPSREQVQEWILGITPSDYFERLFTQQGILVLRAKDPVCHWRGLHIALSDEGQTYLCEQVLRVASGRVDAVQLHCSLPDGRAWFQLYTSGVDFGSWWRMELELAPQATPSSVSVRFMHSSVQVQLAEQSALALAKELAQPLFGGVLSSLALRRETRPSADPQALWLWHWPARRSAGSPVSRAK